MKDFCYFETQPTLTNSIDLVYQQLDMLFDTYPREVLGSPDYGSDFDKYLYDLRITNTMIKMYIDSLLDSSIDWMGWDFKTNIDILQGTENDIILINIIIFNSEESYEKIYKITH